MEKQQVLVGLRGGYVESGCVCSDLLELASVAEGFSLSRIIDQDPAHGLSGGGKEVGSIFPGRLAVSPET